MRRLALAATSFALLYAAAAGCAHKKEDVKSDAPPVARHEAPPPAATPAAAASTPSASKDEPACGTVRVHFELNSSELLADDKPELERAGQCLRHDHGLRVTIEGNADERGTEEYNLALGDRRAQSVARYLESLGASGAQLKTVSYGKDNPECAEHNEACWARNRRAAVKPTSR
jgi:peptidoglycan-associated lipoprotein